MIMFRLKFTKKIPVQEIYIHGLIRDNAGNKMSKTKGNVIDPLKIIKNKQIQTINNIEYFPTKISHYDVDALRFTFCIIATDNISIKLDINKIENYKKFCNKLWNASRFDYLNSTLNNNKTHKKIKSIKDKWII